MTRNRSGAAMVGSKALGAAVAVLGVWPLASGAWAQNNRSWVDPPRQGQETPPSAPAGAPRPADSISPPERQPGPSARDPAPPNEASPSRTSREQDATEPPDEKGRPRPAAQDPRPPRLPPPRPAESAGEASPAENARRRRPPSDPGPPPGGERRRADPEDVAERFAADYLAFWSAPNAVTLDSLPDFYAPLVSYHGRRLSAREVFGEKLRFVRRWPQRRYTPRADTMRASCAPAAQFCTVRTVFDFSAMNPERGMSSSGLGTLELGVSLAGDRPLIVQERSSVARRGRPGPRFEALDGGR